MKKISFLIYIFFITFTGFSQDRIGSKNFATRSEVIAQNGMAATSHPLATQVALDILKSGGNAIDAAIAANATLGLMEPTGNGIGGDLFAIVWDSKTQKLHGLNASGRSPKNLTFEYFKTNNYEKIPALGALPVSVPGAVDGWYELHDKFGSKPMNEILQPAINYARSGFPVTELIGYYLTRSAAYFSKYPGFEETYMINGEPLKKGDIFKNPDLANTYEIIAKKGKKAFYEGEIAKKIVEIVQDQGGFLSLDDLKAHESEWVKPVSVNYRGYDVWELPPNGQGIAALQILQILEGYDIRSMGFGSAEYIHTFVEAKKLAFADRAKYYADPNFTKIPVEELLSDRYAEERRKIIDPNKSQPSVEAGKLKDGDTIYLTVADKDGNMVSLIQSNFRGMGSGLIPEGCGFMLQDRGELFTLEEGHANVYEPMKRPFHTIIPAFVTKDGQPYISFGLMGGSMQPQGHAQIIVNLVDFDMNLQEAGDAPRIRHDGSSQPTGGEMTDGGEVSLESGIEYDEIKQLLLKGHRIRFSNGGYGGYQAIMYDKNNKVYYGASESRKDGQAAGY
ncbi:gamma-glutamyltransferase [Marinigracilibium pacificum]|uniref:Glutathione hydrolase proenzyme n=1 Tax=Marinigracilibium pacificum TaxID=2729599 RepID=A0A848IZC9_9BACT|nr:gamma-glutamyltransferase [Marinigracilibium pacificum]NMM49893.1 gamma-glutamyltransferase [Marinigracilibium pacificum]